MLRIISLNLNGIRSAVSKGFLDWLAQHDADLVCLQELKAQSTDLSPAMRSPTGLQSWFHHAEKKGYSGVGIYSRHAPDRVIEGLGICVAAQRSEAMRKGTSPSSYCGQAQFDSPKMLNQILDQLEPGGAKGQASDIKIQAEWMLRTREKLNRILSECTGKSIEQVAIDTERDNFMPAEEALQYGLIDKVIYKR